MADAASKSKGKAGKGKGQKGKGGKGKGGKGKGKGGAKRKTGLAIAHKKATAFSDWYTEVITRSEMIDYYTVGGCYILRPWSFSIWESITEFMNGHIKSYGVQNAYFPMFVTRAALTKEEDHVEGFAPEVAWVTHSGDSELAEHIAIRPTSETIMYPAYADWVQSHRDLPLRLNQWTNIVRWEFKSPTPFLRTREFLWQEGHSAFATKEEADKEVLQILDLYARTYEELLAVPMIKGRKSEKEKFAGGLYTTTVEGFIPTNGRAIQAATSHCLGQNFSKMFGIDFLDEKGEQQYAWQNSWGFTTRSIGVMVMVHGDDQGLVLPPRVAPKQVVIVWIMSVKDSEEVQTGIKTACGSAADRLKAAGIRVQLDDRLNYKPGWKFNHWEQKGVPLRLECGPRDLAKGQKFGLALDDGFESAIAAKLDSIQAGMLARARAVRDEHVVPVESWDDFVPTLDGRNLVLAPWCETIPCEESVKELTSAAARKEDEGAGAGAGAGAGSKKAPTDEGGAPALSGSAKTLCIPFNQSPLPAGTKCFCKGCDKPAVSWTLWGRSY